MTARRHAWVDLDEPVMRWKAHETVRWRDHLRTRPALLCIDNERAVFGDRPEPLERMVERYPSGCGLAAWDALAPTQALMRGARGAGIPVVHTRRDPAPQPAGMTLEAVTARARPGAPAQATACHEWFETLEPAVGELVVNKRRASPFFGTPLSAHLVDAGIDTVLLCGNATSGCIRAAAMDAFNLGLRVAVVEECVFDRNLLSHRVNLFDMHTKYAPAFFLEEVLAYLGALPERGARPRSSSAPPPRPG